MVDRPHRRPRPSVATGPTASRPTWPDLPAGLRAAVQSELGSPVVEAVSQGSGFTPGFASRLRTADGGAAFVKAADSRRPWLYQAYRTEARKLRLLPAAVAAPRLRVELLRRVDGVDWVVLVLQDVAGRPPHRPWAQTEAERVLAAAVATGRALTPPPAGDWLPLSTEFHDLAERWREVRRLGLVPELLDWAEASSAQFVVGHPRTTLAHSDLRADNVIIGADRIWFCDWNFPTLGPVWTDLLTLAVDWFGDGLDAEALLHRSGLVGEQDADEIDGLLSCLLGYYLTVSRQPPEPDSPLLRRHQAWCGEAVTDWLRLRRQQR